MVTVQGGVDDLVGTSVGLQAKQLVKPHRQQAAHRQQEDQPVVLAPQMGDKMQRVVKARTHQDAKKAPFEKCINIFLRVM